MFRVAGRCYGDPPPALSLRAGARILMGSSEGTPVGTGAGRGFGFAFVFDFGLARAFEAGLDRDFVFDFRLIVQLSSSR
jgi:hypothetical protein